MTIRLSPPSTAGMQRASRNELSKHKGSDEVEQQANESQRASSGDEDVSSPLEEPQKLPKEAQDWDKPHDDFSRQDANRDPLTPTTTGPIYPPSTANVQGCISGPRLNSDARSEQLQGPPLYTELMGLPLELRDMIWTQVFLDHRPIDTIIIRSEHVFRSIVPALCYTNRQILYETLPLFLRDRTITVGKDNHYRMLIRILDRVPYNAAYRSVRSLVLNNFWGWDCAGLLLPRCSALHYVTVEIPAFMMIYRVHRPAYLSREDGQRYRYFFESKEDVHAGLELSSLLRCDSLKSMKLICKYGNLYTSRMKCTREFIFKYLVERAEEYARNNHGLHLEVEYIN